jgi:MtN3 and saliva related transmembrane protein
MLGLEIIGFSVAAVTTLCWLPQAVRTIRTKDTRALSLLSQSALLVGVLLWLVYGLLVGDGPLIVSNIVTFMLVGTILVMKLRYG